MYRNVAYKLDKDWSGVINLYTWDDKRKPIDLQITHQSYLYYEHPDGEYVSMFNTKLQKKYFNSVIERNKWITNNPNVKLFGCLPPEREFLIDYFKDSYEDESFRNNKLRIHFFDIEVAIEDEFPQPSDANYPINVLTVYDNFLDKYFVWVLRDKRWCKPDLSFNDEWTKNILNVKNRDKKIPNVKYFVFDTEHNLLKHYINWYSTNRPDIISGWNIENFDIPYLVNRCTKFFEPEEMNLFSPTGDIRKVTREQRGATQQIESYKFVGTSIIDYYLLYKHKFTLEKKPSYSLGNISEDELGYGKMEYQGTMKEFYKSDFKKFVGYNIIDVMLCVDLDENLQYIELARTICNMGLCEYEAIFRSSPYITGAINLQALKMDRILLSDSRIDYGNSDVSFTGAYVFPVEPKSYKHGIASIDLNSLYPNVMINLNISPETKIGRIVDSTDEYIMIKLNNSKTPKKILRSNIEQLFGKITISSNNIVYMNPERQKGIVPAFLEKFYNERKSKKNESKSLFKLASKEKDEKIKASLTNKAEVLDRVQNAYKIFLNSIYGQNGNKYFCLFDIDNAEAVTLSGQTINKESAVFINNYLNKKYSTNINYIAAGDTDSLYINIEPITRELFGIDNVIWNEDNVKKYVTFLDNELMPLINENAHKITREKFLSPLKNIEFKREKLCSRAVFYAKKMNILHVVDNEGVYMDLKDPKSWKCTGVQIKKNELPEKIKDVLRYITYNAIEHDWDNSKYLEELTRIWNEFKTIGPDELGFNKTYSTEKDSDGFMQTEKGTGAHAKAAIYYNQVISDLKLKHKYSEIRVGENLRFTYISKGNKYGINVIGWQNKWPQEFDGLFEVDYKTMFDKVVISPLKKLIEIYNWSNRHPDDEVVTDIFQL